MKNFKNKTQLDKFLRENKKAFGFHDLYVIGGASLELVIKFNEKSSYKEKGAFNYTDWTKDLIDISNIEIADKIEDLINELETDKEILNKTFKACDLIRKI
jgi:hypothetical protein